MKAHHPPPPWIQQRDRRTLAKQSGNNSSTTLKVHNLSPAILRLRIQTDAGETMWQQQSDPLPPSCCPWRAQLYLAPTQGRVHGITGYLVRHAALVILHGYMSRCDEARRYDIIYGKSQMAMVIGNSKWIRVWSRLWYDYYCVLLTSMLIFHH